jgi:hypothetical protein
LPAPLSFYGTPSSEKGNQMGADIHVVIEYSTTADFLRPCGLAFTEWPRHTDLFVAMSGLWNHPSLIPARGFPNPASWLANQEYGLQVVDTDDIDAMLTFPSIREDEALEAIEAGKSQFLTHMEGFVSNPAWCWPSWLTKNELLQCIEHGSIERLSLEAEATIAMMEFIENQGHHARMVFWFDI